MAFVMIAIVDTDLAEIQVPGGPEDMAGCVVDTLYAFRLTGLTKVGRVVGTVPQMGNPCTGRIRGLQEKTVKLIQQNESPICHIKV